MFNMILCVSRGDQGDQFDAELRANIYSTWQSYSEFVIS